MGSTVAARLEGLSEPGGICLAQSVFDQVKDKLDLTFEPLGEREVETIAEPLSVYRVVFDDKAAALVTPVVVGQPAPIRASRWPAVAAGLVLGLAALRRPRLVAALGAGHRARFRRAHGLPAAGQALDRRASVREPV